MMMVFRERASQTCAQITCSKSAANVQRERGNYLGFVWSARTADHCLGSGESTPGAVAGPQSIHITFRFSAEVLAAIAHEFVLDLLTFVQRAQAGTLDSRHMHENVLTAVRRLNEAVAFGRIKPLTVPLAITASPRLDGVRGAHCAFAAFIANRNVAGRINGGIRVNFVIFGKSR